MLDCCVRHDNDERVMLDCRVKPGNDEDLGYYFKDFSPVTRNCS